jgi:hypothetical protein
VAARQGLSVFTPTWRGSTYGQGPPTRDLRSRSRAVSDPTSAPPR